MTTIAEKEILSMLESNNVKYKLYEHEPVYTCEQASKVRGIPLSQGIKCLLLKSNKKRFILALTRGDKKVDFKKLAMLERTKKVKLANEDEVKKIAKCSIGCVHPFCKNVKIYVDEILLKNDKIEFNPGCHNKTVRIKVKDLISLLKGPVKIEKFSF